jgi:hypothetical protein
MGESKIISKSNYTIEKIDNTKKGATNTLTKSDIEDTESTSKEKSNKPCEIIPFNNYWVKHFDDGTSNYIYLCQRQFLPLFINQCASYGVRINDYKIYDISKDTYELTPQEVNLFADFVCTDTTIVTNDSQLFETEVRNLRQYHKQLEIDDYEKVIHTFRKVTNRLHSKDSLTEILI